MYNNSVHNKLIQFARPTYISVSEFLSLLETSSRTNKMSIRWETEGSADGSGKPPHMTQHLMWWDSSAYVGGNAGGSDTKSLQDQINLQVTPGTNNWRTLSYENIDMVSFKGRLYKIK
jgi:hypothetical protein